MDIKNYVQANPMKLGEGESLDVYHGCSYVFSRDVAEMDNLHRVSFMKELANINFNKG